MASHNLYSAVTRLMLAISPACLLSASFSNRALADDREAKQHFESLNLDDGIGLMLGLIGSGDFDGLIDFGFTKRFYSAILNFERRRSLAADGIVTECELTVLKQDVAPFYANIGADWIKFERLDNNLSMSFMGFVDTDKSFTALYEKMSTPSPRREVLYKRLRSNYFALNGTYKGRLYYTWISRFPGGSTGFTLAWSQKWDSMVSRLSILLANSFVPVAGKPMASPTSSSAGTIDPDA